MRDFTIGAVSARTDVKVETIRYYERIGIMPEPRRTRGGNRKYADFKDRWASLKGHVGRIGLGNPAPLEASDPSSYRRSMALLHDVIMDMQAEQKRWR